MSKKMLLAQAFYYLAIPLGVLILGGPAILHFGGLVIKGEWLALVSQAAPGFLVVVFLWSAVNNWRRGHRKRGDGGLLPLRQSDPCPVRPRASRA